MSEWEREGLAADNASALWTRKTTPRFGLTIPLALEETMGQRWGERRIAALEVLNGRLRAALTDANIWFGGFGYNRHGIALKDDIPDHAPVVAAIQRALAEEEKP